jgi:hypothetical protein
MGENQRTFTVVRPGKPGGRYVSETPMDAGRKAGMRLFRDADARKSKTNNNVVELELKEITRDDKVAHPKERYFYRVTRTKIPEKDRVVHTFKKPDGSKTKVVALYTYKTVSIDSL